MKQFVQSISFLILTIPFLLILSSCEPTPKEIADQKEKEVIAQHDIAMEKMTAECKKTLNELLSEKNEFMMDSSSHHAAHLPECNKAIKDLEMAEEAMMVWMREYSEASKVTRTDAERITFYDAELVKINAVNEQLTVSLKEAQHFFHNWLVDKVESKKKQQTETQDSTNTSDDKDGDSDVMDSDVDMESTSDDTNKDAQV